MNNVISFPKEKRLHRPIHEIAAEIRHDWSTINPHAEAYLNPMFDLDQITDMYFLDTAESVVLYFLSNARGWRGDKARAIKKELNDIVKLLRQDYKLLEIQRENHKRAYEE